MNTKNLAYIVICTVFLGGCSASYKELSMMEDIKPKNFQEYLLSEYKIKATFEAEEMHDWNSAKLYSEKAIKSLETDKIYPQDISPWYRCELFSPNVYPFYSHSEPFVSRTWI